MTLRDVIKATGGPTTDAHAPVGKISRFPALGDQPGHRTGFALWLTDGALLLSSAHPHSTFILNSHGLNRGMSDGG